MITTKATLGLSAALATGCVVLAITRHKGPSTERSVPEELDLVTIIANESNPRSARHVRLPLDPWKRPYRYQLINGLPVVWSAGADGVDHTADDIRVVDP